MNWEPASVIAEIVGAAGVIASLIYLAVQIKQNTRTERAREFQEIFSSYNAHNNEMFGPQNIDLIIAGMRDINALSGGDRLRFDHLMIGYFNAVEATIFSNTAFLLDDDTLENWGYVLRTRFLPYAGIREWWKEGQPIFAPETRAFVDDQVSATDIDSDVLGIK
jgi:hypothetical protein